MCGGRSFKLMGLRLSCSQGFNPRVAEGIAVPVKRCRDCGLIFSDPQPIPDNLSDHYGIPPEDYWGRRTWEPEYFARQIEAARRLISFRPGMRALDIGAGEGFAMKSLMAAGFDTWGLEPSEPFRMHCIEATGIDPDRIQLAPVEAAEYPPESFDFITFGAVLEHLYDPHEALSKALGWLKPGGVIQAEVPSSDWLISRLVNFYFRLRGTNYVTNVSPMHSPFHLYEFTKSSFRDFHLAEDWLDVCTPVHVPAVLHPLAKWFMNWTGTGMQLTVYLRKV
jgi:SAM-dependent methyltransferase